MDLTIILTIIGLLLVILFGVLPYIIKQRKFKRDEYGLYYYEDLPENLYCSNCYVSKKKKVLLPRNPRICPKCKKNFERNPVIYSCPSPPPKYRIK